MEIVSKPQSKRKPQLVFWRQQQQLPLCLCSARPALSTWPRALQLGLVDWPRSNQPTHLHPHLWHWETCQGLPGQATMWPGPGSRVRGAWSNWDRQREAGRGQPSIVVVGRPGALSLVPTFSVLPDPSCRNSLPLLRTSELAMVSPHRYDSNSSFVAYCSPFGCCLSR